MKSFSSIPFTTSMVDKKACVPTVSPCGNTSSIPLALSHPPRGISSSKSNRMTTTKEKRDIYQEVTNQIIQLLEAGTAPWRKPWSATDYGLAKNFATNHVYSGINMVLFNLIAPYSVPYYLTYKQAKTLGGKVKKGEKSLPVCFYKSYYKDANGKTLSESEAESKTNVSTIKFLKYSNVFNVSQIEGIDFQIPEPEKHDHEPIEACEQFMDNLREVPVIEHQSDNKAFYASRPDIISVPDLSCYASVEEYYSTLFHELIHWTGSEKRLKRKSIIENKGMKSNAYAEEELIAELGASFLRAFTGINTVPVLENSAAYIAHWSAQLKEDSRLIFRASARAQEALNYLLPSK